MTGTASNNVTTQWTFRDGRDYVLSLSTTEIPNTVSFSISDKITGEEWTCCYDENCIEIITKRTGCFKSFDVFLSMIKSAIFKKSESVLLDLLNIQDLAAMSIRRQGTTSTDGGGKGNIPLNFELYNSEANMSSTYHLHAQPQTVPSTDTNNNVDNNGSHKPRPLSPLNKRKYLIVSYIGEFDKVHYPLPLNYSNPPDLNVMQNNIIKLKAEVTSLKSSKKELEDQLESIKLSGGVPQHSHENNSNDVNIGIRLPSTLNSPDMMWKERVFCDQDQNSKARTDTTPKTHIGGSLQDAMNGVGVVDDSKLVVFPTCANCAVFMKKLQETVRGLENRIDAQRGQYYQCVEKLENENRFLRQKVESGEKYEIELWNQIEAIREKVEMKENLVKARKTEAIKDACKNRCHTSRHELFYNMKQCGDAKPAETFLSRSPARMGKYVTGEIHTNCDRNLAEYKFNQRSRSNSTASYSSAGRNSNESRFDRNRAVSRENRKIRSSSSYRAINFVKDMPKGRSGSFSPLQKFDPTGYVAEKKLRQSRISNLRIQKIESRIQTGSKESITRRQSQSPCTSPHLRTTTYSNKRSLSQEYCSIPDKKPQVNGTDGYSRKDKCTLPNVKAKAGSGVTISRPSSIESGKTKILSSAVPRLPLGEKLVKSPAKTKTGGKTPRKKPLALNRGDLDKGNCINALSLMTQLKDRLLHSPGKKPTLNTKRKSRMSSIAVNTSFTCDQPDPLVVFNENSKLGCGKEKNGKCDIAFLQEKLFALNAFLETCKSKE